MAENLVDFAIITAIEVERQAICKALQMTDSHRVFKEPRTYWQNRLEFQNGEFYEIVVTQLHDAATIDAVRAVDDVIRHWKPAALLMVGIAAAAKENVKLGDLVVAREVCYYERGKETVDGILPEPKQYTADETLWGHVISLPTWKSAISISRPDGLDTRPKIHYAVIASGEKVIANAEIRDEIAASNRKIAAIEMEGYGVSAGAYKQHQPVRCLVIRAISDFADASKNDEWQPYAASVAAEFTKHFLLDKPLPLKRQKKSASLPSTVFDKHYNLLKQSIIQGQLIPFLGEEINSCECPSISSEWQPDSSYPPSDYDLAQYLANKYSLGTPSAPIQCPNWEQLKEGGCPVAKLSPNLAFSCPLFGTQRLVREPNDLPFLSQSLDLIFGTMGLYSELHQIFDKDYEPNQLHNFFAQLPSIMRNKSYPLPYQLIVTTNYDDTLERAFKEAGQPFDLVSYIANSKDDNWGKFVHQPYIGKQKVINKPNIYNDFPFGKHPIILKLYGAIDREWGQKDNFVITEDHYMDYLSKTNIPTIFVDLMRKNHILFLGYDLSKWKQRLIFRRILQDKPLDQCKSWAVRENFSELEKKLWYQSQVDIIDLPQESSLGAYINELNKQVEAIPKKVQAKTTN